MEKEEGENKRKGEVVAYSASIVLFLASYFFVTGSIYIAFRATLLGFPSGFTSLDLNITMMLGALSVFLYVCLIAALYLILHFLLLLIPADRSKELASKLWGIGARPVSSGLSWPKAAALAVFLVGGMGHAAANSYVLTSRTIHSLNSSCGQCRTIETAAGTFRGMPLGLQSDRLLLLEQGGVLRVLDWNEVRAIRPN